MNEIKLPMKVVNELYNYLGSKPYLEVSKYLRVIENAYVAQQPPAVKQIPAQKEVDEVVRQVSEHNEESMKKLAKAHGVDDESDS
jgi:hypothetical protein